LSAEKKSARCPSVLVSMRGGRRGAALCTSEKFRLPLNKQVHRIEI